MKKILALAVGMLLIPFTAFGMQMMSDGDMDSITGQSGVAISVSNIQVYSSNFGEELWFETVDAEFGKAAVGLVYGEGSYSYTFINSIPNPGALVDSNTFQPEFGLETALGTAAAANYITIEDGVGITINDDTEAAAIVNQYKNRMLRGDYDGLENMYTDNSLRDYGPRQDNAVLSIRVVPQNLTGLFGLAYGSDDVVISTDTVGELTLTATELDSVGMDGLGNSDGAYVEIGLPTAEIFTVAGSQDVLQIFVVGESGYATNGPIGTDVNTNTASMRIGTMYTTDGGGTTAIMGGKLGITSYGQIEDKGKNIYD